MVSAPTNSIGALMGDRLRIQQILINLIGNAIKFTQQGEIVISARPIELTKESAIMEFSVKDTGIGLTPEQTSRLFSAFEQADGSTTRKYGGTGLGLSICKRLITIMDGEIWIKSEPNVGSTFFFKVPLGRVSKSKRCRPIVPDMVRTMKVLVVDDNESARMVMTDTLDALGLDSHALSTGHEALEELRTTSNENDHYAVVLLDWRMPGMDGLEAAKYILSDHTYTYRPDPLSSPDERLPKVIMMTAFGHDHVITQAKKIGVDSFLLKPMTPTILLDAILWIFGISSEKKHECKKDGIDKADLIQTLGGARILLVEDNTINQRVAREILEGVAISVTVAGNGQESLDILENNRFDLILMDIQMPVMDGHIATKRIRSERRYDDIPIVAMTAHALTGDREHCLAMGMDDYVTKPIVIEKLFGALTKWIKPQGHERPKKLSDSSVLAPHVTESTHGPLPKLQGIDTEDALKRLGGNKTLFREMWVEFRTEHVRSVDKLRAALFNEKNIDSARQMAHAIKGVSGNLGATPLFKAALALEKSIADDDSEHWKERLDTFGLRLQEVLESTAQLAPSEPNKVSTDIKAEQRALSEADVALVDPILKQLADWIVEGNINAVDCLDDLRSTLEGSVVDQPFRALSRALGDFDFEQAGSQLELINSRLHG
ncbi:MAG: response regulator [Magnetococcales bacterium]|nr:response regulator [Magnetococcales bacterium]